MAARAVPREERAKARAAVTSPQPEAEARTHPVTTKAEARAKTLTPEVKAKVRVRGHHHRVPKEVAKAQNPNKDISLLDCTPFYSFSCPCLANVTEFVFSFTLVR